MTKPRLTADEHTQLGRRLAAMRKDLTTLYVQLANAYPQTGLEAAPARKLEKARQAIDDARSHLENALYREYPEQAETTVYYPHPEDRARTN